MDFEVSPFLAYQRCNGMYDLLPRCVKTKQFTCATVTLTADTVVGGLLICPFTTERLTNLIRLLSDSSAF